MDQVPEGGDLPAEDSLPGEDQAGDPADGRDDPGQVAGELDMCERIAAVETPVLDLIPDIAYRKGEPAERMQQDHDLRGRAEGQKVDGKAGQGLDEEEAGHEDGQARCPLRG